MCLRHWVFTGDINIVLTGLAHTVSPGMRLAGKSVTNHHELVTRKPKGTWGFFFDLGPHQTSVHFRAQAAESGCSGLDHLFVGTDGQTRSLDTFNHSLLEESLCLQVGVKNYLATSLLGPCPTPYPPTHTHTHTHAPTFTRIQRERENNCLFSGNSF